MMEGGWIKLYRKMTQWEWYKTPHMFHLFGHLLLTANRKDEKWKGKTIKRGQRMFGYRKLSQETGISVRSIRTCIERLKSTHEVTIESTQQYSIVTVCNYEDYQSIQSINDTRSDTDADKRPTHDRHNFKKYKEEERREEGDFDFLTGESNNSYIGKSYNEIMKEMELETPDSKE